MALNGGKKAKRPARGDIVAALDVGTTKVCCFIARVEDKGAVRVVGIGHQLSRGLKAGTIVDMEAAETSIAHAVHQAEQMAEAQIRQVVVNVSGGQPTSRTIPVEVPLGGGEIGDAELRRVMSQARQVQANPDQKLLHTIPTGFSIDGNRGIRDPRGMSGDRLAVQLHVVAAQGSAVRNLQTSVARCHLDVGGMVISPYAAGLSALVEDEMELGATVIDMGGGTTSMAVFVDGRLVFTDSVPVGGAHVTNDIARGLTTPVVHAERLKTLYGSAMAADADERDYIDVPQVGEDEPAQANHVPKSLLVGIIQPRLEEIFELVRDRLDHGGFGRAAGRRVVLTGGASQLPGTRELAQLILDKQVRAGRPTRVGGLAEATGGPAFATAAGLLIHAVQGVDGLPMLAEVEAPRHLLGRVGTWIREYL
ncbi:cell division protein FtsA [Arenibaculum pallidiluteum]|uniref:cell division protein FtsA n=1 Tax=Arenibaculum pallidiluteum TaxID=2812559 RepID=UPI001A96347D|nr:cell division protein FtsA [Arenibaculum pallidiluteum]